MGQRPPEFRLIQRDRKPIREFGLHGQDEPLHQGEAAVFPYRAIPDLDLLPFGPLPEGRAVELP